MRTPACALGSRLVLPPAPDPAVRRGRRGRGRARVRDHVRVVRNELRGEVDHSLATCSSRSRSRRGCCCPGSSRRRDVLVLPPGRSAAATATPRSCGPTARSSGPRGSHDFSSRSTSGCSRWRAGERKAFFSDATIGGVHARVYTAPLSTGDAVQAVRPLEEVDRTLRDLAFALVLVSLGGVALAVWLGLLVARAALTPVKQLTDAAEHVARTRDLSAPDPRRPHRRAQPPGRELQHDAGGARRSGALATPARRRRLARAAHSAHQPAHEHRGAVVGRAARGGPRAAAAGRRRPARRADGAGHRPGRPRARRRAGAGAEDVRLDMLVEDAVERARRHAPDKVFFTELEPSLVAGRARPPRPGRDEPARQRREVEPGRRPDRGPRARRRGQRARPRARHRRRRPAIRLRPLLPRAGGARPAGLGPRPRDRAPGGRVARRRGDRRARATAAARA